MDEMQQRPSHGGSPNDATASPCEQERRRQISGLQRLVDEGIESGVAEDFSMDVLQAELDKA